MKIKALNFLVLTAFLGQFLTITTKAEASDYMQEFEQEQQAIKQICSPLKDGIDNALCELAVLEVGSKTFVEIGQKTASAPTKVFNNLGNFCKASVTDSLKSPASARYPNKPEIRELFKGIYVVTGKVDAQNSYGALLRKNYYCYMYYSSKKKVGLMGLSVD